MAILTRVLLSYQPIINVYVLHLPPNLLNLMGKTAVNQPVEAHLRSSVFSPGLPVNSSCALALLSRWRTGAEGPEEKLRRVQQKGAR